MKSESSLGLLLLYIVADGGSLLSYDFVSPGLRTGEKHSSNGDGVDLEPCAEAGWLPLAVKSMMLGPLPLDMLIGRLGPPSSESSCGSKLSEPR